jgi:glycosyltransferase involved in cell wall biosynthesis
MSPAGRRVLQLLSQRPDSTGSGTTVAALAACARDAGWDPRLVAALPRGEEPAPVGGCPPDAFHPLRFGAGDAPSFDIPGMSDVMPYPSTVFSEMSSDQLRAYREAWRDHLAAAVARIRPALIHSHHVWLLGAMVKDVAPGLPVVTHCHATGLRQLRACPGLAEEVRRGCARNDRFVVLTPEHVEALVDELGVAAERVRVVGAGFRDDLFHTAGRDAGRADDLLYAGKLSRAKGLPWLLDAFERLRRLRPEARLHVAGAGSGDEADALRARMRRMEPGVVLHGQLTQAELADRMRGSTVFVLPSFYEGLPLVLVEALACGCRLVCTELPGGVTTLARSLGDAMRLVPPPGLVGTDRPRESDLPRFVEQLTRELGEALDDGPVADPAPRVAPFTWHAVFERVETVWRELL